MTQTDPVISKLLDIKQRDQEARLNEITSEIRVLKKKLEDLVAENAGLDQREDGYGRMSVANGYLRYLEHRRETIMHRMNALQSEAKQVQDSLRKTLFSQSMLQQSQGM